MKLLLTFSFLFVLSCFNTGFAAGIVPLPYRMETNGKTFLLPRDINFDVLLAGDDYTALKSFHAGIRSQDPGFDALCAKLGFFKEDIGDEGYELWIDNKQIVLAANSERGIFYGKQSLKQLIRSSTQNKLSGVHIIDKPAFKYRGLMDDISRGPVPTKAYMEYQIRRISELKMNMLCYYTEHVVRTEKHPEFAPPAGGISIEEWKEIAGYARRHFVELVPNFQSLGHAEKVLENPKYRHLGESSTMYSPVRPETVLFMKDIYDEMCPAFSSGFFHVNCDETFDLGKGESKKLADSIGLAGVYARYVDQLAVILRGHRKRMMIWGDIALKYPEILDMLPSDAVIMSWEYGDHTSYSKWIDPFVTKGFDYFVCTGVLNSNRMFPDYGQALPNIRDFVREGAEKGALGVLNTVWDDGGMHSFDLDWYGVAYGAEQSWNPNDRDVNDFDSRLSAGIYKGNGSPLFSAIHQLTEMGKTGALEGMGQQAFWKTVIPDRGQYVSYNLSGWNGVYADCLKADSVLGQNTSSDFSGEYAAVQFVLDEYKYLALAKLNMAQASEWYARACCIQYSDREGAARLLKDARKSIVACKSRFDQLKADFSAIWQNENRYYWSDYAMDPFTEVQRDYTGLLESFDRSAAYFSRKLPLSAPVDIRLDIRAATGSYFTYWLISPAFDLSGGTGFETDFLKEMGGERNASPFPGFSFTDDKGRTIKWTKYSSPLSDRVLFNDMTDAGNKAVAYAFCTLESPGAREAVVYLGLNKSMDVFCNGEQVFQQKDENNLTVDGFRVPLRLKPGKNRILLKVEKGDNGWGFSFSIKDGKITSSKNKYRIE